MKNAKSLLFVVALLTSCSSLMPKEKFGNPRKTKPDAKVIYVTSTDAVLGNILKTSVVVNKDSIDKTVLNTCKERGQKVAGYAVDEFESQKGIMIFNVRLTGYSYKEINVWCE